MIPPAAPIRMRVAPTAIRKKGSVNTLKSWTIEPETGLLRNSEFISDPQQLSRSETRGPGVSSGLALVLAPAHHVGGPRLRLCCGAPNADCSGRLPREAGLVRAVPGLRTASRVLQSGFDRGDPPRVSLNKPRRIPPGCGTHCRRLRW